MTTLNITDLQKGDRVVFRDGTIGIVRLTSPYYVWIAKRFKGYLRRGNSQSFQVLKKKVVKIVRDEVEYEVC